MMVKQKMARYSNVKGSNLNIAELLYLMKQSLPAGAWKHYDIGIQMQ